MTNNILIIFTTIVAFAIAQSDDQDGHKSDEEIFFYRIDPRTYGRIPLPADYPPSPFVRELCNRIKQWQSGFLGFGCQENRNPVKDFKTILDILNGVDDYGNKLVKLVFELHDMGRHLLKRATPGNGMQERFTVLIRMSDPTDNNAGLAARKALATMDILEQIFALPQREEIDPVNAMNQILTQFPAHEYSYAKTQPFDQDKNSARVEGLTIQYPGGLYIRVQEYNWQRVRTSRSIRDFLNDSVLKLIIGIRVKRPEITEIMECKRAIKQMTDADLVLLQAPVGPGSLFTILQRNIHDLVAQVRKNISFRSNIPELLRQAALMELELRKFMAQA